MLKVAPIFKEHMVLQREKTIRVWGTTDRTEPVELLFEEESYMTIPEQGVWSIGIPPMKAGGPYVMRISCAQEEILLNDVLVGEVWLAGGQSNMELELKDSDDGLTQAQKADDPSIRFFNVPKLSYESADFETIWEQADWKLAQGLECGCMSAVAFYFAVKLQKELRVPIGIIDCYWGGTSALCWLSEERVRKQPRLHACYKEYYDGIADQTEEMYDALMQAYEAEYSAWNGRVEQLRREKPDISWEEINERAGLCPWPQPAGKKSPFRPCGLHATMIQRVAPYTIRGFLYYQGEEDWSRSDFYCLLNTQVIRQWRHDFEDETLDFYITQLPMYIAKGEEDDKNWCILRQQQEQTVLENDRTGMAVLIDCGEFDNIHPTDKKTPGERLALQALGKTYEAVEAYDNMYIDHLQKDGNRLLLTFRNTYGTIVLKPKDQLWGFEISEDGIQFYEAQGFVKGDTISLWSWQVCNPFQVRYAWTNFGKANVYNHAQLPLAPFWRKIAQEVENE